MDIMIYKKHQKNIPMHIHIHIYAYTWTDHWNEFNMFQINTSQCPSRYPIGTEAAAVAWHCHHPPVCNTANRPRSIHAIFEGFSTYKRGTLAQPELPCRRIVFRHRVVDYLTSVSSCMKGKLMFVRFQSSILEKYKNNMSPNLTRFWSELFTCPKNNVSFRACFLVFVIIDIPTALVWILRLRQMS